MWFKCGFSQKRPGRKKTQWMTMLSAQLLSHPLRCTLRPYWCCVYIYIYHFIQSEGVYVYICLSIWPHARESRTLAVKLQDEWLSEFGTMQDSLFFLCVCVLLSIPQDTCLVVIGWCMAGFYQGAGQSLGRCFYVAKLSCLHVFHATGWSCNSSWWPRGFQLSSDVLLLYHSCMIRHIMDW